MRRLRVNVRHVSPAHVTVSLFQSDNGVNWACVASDVTFGREWFESIFGAGLAVEDARFEFGIGTLFTVGERD